MHVAEDVADKITGFWACASQMKTAKRMQLYLTEQCETLFQELFWV